MDHTLCVFIAGSLLLFLHYSTEAFHIPECGTDGYVDVLEFKETTLTCQGLSQGPVDGILWMLVQNGMETRIATCTIWSCQAINDKPYFSVTQSSTSNSVLLTILQGHRQINGGIFRCSHYTGVWSNSAECTLRVIYGPSSAVLSGPQHVILAGSRTVLTCTTDDVNPGAYNTWTGVICIQPQGNGSSCLFTPSVGDDGKTVTCKATNTRVHNISATSTYTLDISYPPSSQPSITGYPEEGFLTEGDTVQLVCTVHGGKPVVSSVIFKCDGRPDDHGTISSDRTRSTLSFQASVLGDNGTSCTCTGDWSLESSFYQLTSTVTLHVAAAARPRITSLSLNSVEVDLTVDTLKRVVARCSAISHPLPSISLVRADTGLQLMRDTDADPTVLGAADYTLTSSARCQDAAIYTCRANNTAGRDERNVTLFVNCAPTVDDEDLNSKSHQFAINASTELVLPLIVYPSPENNVGVFLGESVPMETYPTNGTESNAIRLTCQRNKDVIYKCLCTISITDKADTRSGYYMVTLSNPFGSVSISVYVVHGFKKTDDADTTKALPIAAIAGGAAAAVVSVIFIILIIIFIVRRRQKSSRGQEKRSTQSNIKQEDDNELEEHTNTMYGMSEPSEETPAPTPAAAKPVAVAWRISAGSQLNSESRTDDAASEEYVINQETDERYSSVSDERPQRVALLPDGDRSHTANSALNAHRANEDTDNFPCAQSGTGDYQDLEDQDDRYEVLDDERDTRCKSETAQADMYAVVDKSKKKMRSAVSSPSLGATPVSTQGPDGDLYAEVVKPSRKRNPGAESTQQKQGSPSEVFSKPTVKPKPAAKPKPAVKPKSSRTESSTKGSDVGVENSAYAPDTIAAEQENDIAPFSRQNLSHNQTGGTSEDADGEYNTLNLVNPRAARRNEFDPEYSHIASI